MNRYEWKFNQPCWLGYIDAEGWYMYAREMQSEDFDSSDVILLINERGKEDIRKKDWIRKSFKNSNGKVTPPEIVGLMKAKYEILMSRIEARSSGYEFDGWPGLTNTIGSIGTRAYDPSSGERDSSVYCFDRPSNDGDDN